MGLISVVKRYFDGGGSIASGRMAALVLQERALLEQAIGGVPYELVDEDDDLCRVITDRFTVIFSWDWRDRWIDASVRLSEAPSPPLDHHPEHSARAWLEAQGLPALSRRSGPKSPALLRDELESLRHLVTLILSDERKTKEALSYLDGRSRGYTDRVVVPEEAPPQLVTDWVEQRSRLRARN